MYSMTWLTPKINWSSIGGTHGLLSNLRMARELRKSSWPSCGGRTVRRLPWRCSSRRLDNSPISYIKKICMMWYVKIIAGMIDIVYIKYIHKLHEIYLRYFHKLIVPQCQDSQINHIFDFRWNIFKIVIAKNKNLSIVPIVFYHFCS